ncbi:universal stress protein UspA [Bacteroidota bacterium]|nr:universal stress protein UspA [Bacteroidota bacterium]
MSLNIKRILVPTDFSEISLNALDYAATIAAKDDAEIILLHVYETPDQSSKIKLAIDLNEIMEKGINDKINELKVSNRSLLSARVTIKVLNGKIHSEIQKLADDMKVDLIVMGTHGSSGISDISKMILGSNAYRVVNSCSCPVLTIRNKNTNIRFKDIILPIDSSKESKMKLDMAISWAKAFDATIHLLAVTAFFEELYTEFKDLKKTISAIETRLQKAGINYTLKSHRHQRISESVLEYADKMKADLVFIVTGNESAIAETIIRSAARTIVTESKCPVMSINIGD